MNEKKLDNLVPKLERDEKGRLLPNQPSLNPAGRPKGKTLKEYQAEWFREMTDEQKEEWLKDMPKDIRWKMAEGNPSNDLKMGADDDLKEYLAKLNKLLG